MGIVANARRIRLVFSSAAAEKEFAFIVLKKKGSCMTDEKN